MTSDAYVPTREDPVVSRGTTPGVRPCEPDRKDRDRIRPAQPDERYD